MPVQSGSFESKEIPIGEFTVKIAEIKNPEIFFDELLKKSPDHPDMEDERIPYWCELWPSSIALSEFLAENPDLVKEKSVIEIGCGLGLSGIVAARLGGNVTLTDYLQQAIDIASENWKFNFDTDADVRILDWRKPENFKRFDVLLASDVAYESRSFKTLIKAIKILVKKKGIILISEPNRKFAKDFFEELKENGFTLKEEQREVVKDKIKYRISVYLIRLFEN